jgi:hypothetical protein
MTVRAEMAQVKSAALSGAGTVAVVAPPLKSLQTTSSADSAQIRPSKLSDYLCLTKPEVTFLVLIATALGGYMAVESPDILVLCHAVFGTALVAGGTAALNHYIEREHDAKMRRTANRLSRHLIHIRAGWKPLCDRTSTPGEQVWAGIGWVQNDSTGAGLFVEHHGDHEDTVRNDIELSLKALMQGRNIDFGQIHVRITGGTCLGQPLCALVAAAYESRPWRT